MVCITVKNCKDGGEKIHKALSGCKAYVNNDIILSQEDKDVKIYLAPDNKNVIEIISDSVCKFIKWI